MRNMLTGDNPARAGEDSYGKSEAIMIPPKGTGPLLKQRRDCGCIFAVGLSGMITIRCICTDKAENFSCHRKFKICSFRGTAKTGN